MKSYKRDLYFNLALSIILTVFLPLGIVGIIMGATKGSTAVLVVGIVMTVLGFYGAPISWAGYGGKCKKAQILHLILNENIYSVNDLTEQLAHESYDKKAITGILNSFIAKGYLKGFILKNGELVANNNQKRVSTKNKTFKCDYCGARMKETQDVYVCEYCGNKIKK